MAAADDAVWPPWEDLPLDLVRDISCGLHAATDYIRFHAACESWHQTLPPSACRPAFLPWLLSPPDSTTNRRRARCVFSSMLSRRGSAATEVWVPNRRWVIRSEDGTAASTLASCPDSGSLLVGVDPLTGSAGAAPLPRLPSDDETKWWADHAVGMVSGDGTNSLYVIGPVYRAYYMPQLNAAVLHHGDMAWTLVREHLPFYSSTENQCCVVYHDGKIVLCNSWDSWCIKTRQVQDQTGENHSLSISGPWQYQEHGKVLQSHYLLESRDEILWAHVLVNHAHYYHVDLDPNYITVDSFAKGLLVLVYALEDAQGGKPRWVKRDNQSLVDCVMFLGHPTSFAVDAQRFGLCSGGCAYFVIKSRLFGGMWSKAPLNRCRVFKYNFYHGKSELVEQLPPEWTDDACMWITPQPSIASTEEIRERLESSHKKQAEQQFGPYFRIYVGNLQRKVDCCRLRQFFSKHGKVADARIMCHIKTKHSRGFGFVTMAIAVDDEPASVIAKLDGQVLNGRPLRVKLADEKNH